MHFKKCVFNVDSATSSARLTLARRCWSGTSGPRGRQREGERKRKRGGERKREGERGREGERESEKRETQVLVWHVRSESLDLPRNFDAELNI
jgi:hypothetical protein